MGASAALSAHASAEPCLRAVHGIVDSSAAGGGGAFRIAIAGGAADGDGAAGADLGAGSGSARAGVAAGCAGHGTSGTGWRDCGGAGREGLEAVVALSTNSSQCRLQILGVRV